MICNWLTCSASRHQEPLMKTLLVPLFLLLAGANVVLSSPVGPNAVDEVAAVFTVNDGWRVYVLRTNGEVYTLGGGISNWILMDDAVAQFPLPVSDIADWRVGYLVTQSGDAWFFDTQTPQSWKPVPPLPWGIVPTNEASLGSLKSIFR